MKALENRLDLRLEDYRDVQGRFDRIVSIEMIEAVGREYLPRYFDLIRERLKPGGLCVLQAITIAEEQFADYCRRPDFIQRYIFPGGFLPSKTLLRETLERAGLRLASMETFGDSYALTLREWRRAISRRVAGDREAWLPTVVPPSAGGNITFAIARQAFALGRDRCRPLWRRPCRMTTRGCVLGGLVCRSVGWSRLSR